MKPQPITLRDSDRLGITARLTVPLFPIARAIDLAADGERFDTRLSTWLERQTPIFAWQFIELAPSQLHARTEGCGKKKIDGLNTLLDVLKLPRLGTPLDNDLVRHRLSRTVHPRNQPEMDLRFAMFDWLVAWEHMPRSEETGRTDYRQFVACDERMLALARKYLTDIAENDGVA